MKKQLINQILLCLTVYFFMTTSLSRAQFAIIPSTSPPANWGRTNSSIQGIGIGNFPTATPTNSRFHINNFYCSSPTGPLNGYMFRTDADSTRESRWQMFTGDATHLSEKGKLFVLATCIPPRDSGGRFRPDFSQHFNVQASAGDLILNALGDGTNKFGPGFPTEVVRVTRIQTAYPYSGGRFAEGRVSITRNSQGPCTTTNIETPISMLHMGDAINTAGARPWMHVGTSCTAVTDIMYVGLKEINNDIADAVVCFGNNPASNSSNGDRMRFLFTAAGGNGISSGADGIELGHFWSEYKHCNNKHYRGSS